VLKEYTLSKYFFVLTLSIVYLKIAKFCSYILPEMSKEGAKT